jgi:hypothetical protein
MDFLPMIDFWRASGNFFCLPFKAGLSLNSLENWCHFHPNILQSGRITHYINPKLNEEVFK